MSHVEEPVTAGRLSFDPFVPIIKQFIDPAEPATCLLLAATEANKHLFARTLVGSNESNERL